MAISFPVMAQQKTAAAIIQVDLDAEKQVIHSFGASDCWTTKYIGEWRNKAKKQQVADYLFSMKTDAKGNPKGIGLSLWRFNIGAGSWEQGVESGIPSESRREECFLQADGSYDWHKQAGQQWFLEAARQRGVRQFLGFSISPPVYYTQDHKAYGLASKTLNLQPDKQAAFADFLVKVAQHFKASKTPFDYISPFNEPQWNWGEHPSQEGTGATNAEMAAVIRLLGRKLQEAGTPSKIAFGEAGHWNALYANNQDGRGDQINAFFNPASPDYIGNVPTLLKMLSTHSYFTTCPDTTMIHIRQSAVDRRNAVAPGLALWQTEFGVLGDICKQYSGAPKHTDINYGLYIARVIHHDLAVGQVSAWHWWLAVNTYDYSDGLVYINDNKGGFDMEAMKQDGIVSDSRQLWCLGNYARFVRPGMVRVPANADGITDPLAAAASGLLVSAYKDKAARKLVLVVINTNTTEKQLQLNTPLKGGKLHAYTTSETQNLQHAIVPADGFTIGPKSVTTLVAQLL